MGTDTRFSLPPKLPVVVRHYAGQVPDSVRFRLPTWEAALAEIPGKPTGRLSDPGITTESKSERFRALGDRVVARDAVVDVCSLLNVVDDEAVIAAFVLVMAWGSGTSNSRSLRNTRNALQDVRAAATILRESALALRAVENIDDPALAEVYRRFSLPGIREPFFTKWFALAGIVPDRDWQPLILDSRVRNTLHKTLGVWLNQLADKRRDPDRYIAYLTALHAWAAELPPPMSATRLEWIMFTHNGSPI